MNQRNSKEWAWLRALKRAKRAAETLGHAVADAAQGPIGTRELETPAQELKESDVRREQVFAWLGQRQAYVDDHFNGRRQDMSEVVAESIKQMSQRLTPEERAILEGPKDYEWDEAKQEFVPKTS